MPRVILVTKDTRSGVFSVGLNDGEVDHTEEFDDSHLVDVDAGGQVLGIEILTPDDPKISEMAARFGFEDRVPEIEAAVAAAFAPRVATVGSFQFQTVDGSAGIVGGEPARAEKTEKSPPRELIGS